MLNKETLQHIEAQALAAAAKPISIDGGSNVVLLPDSVSLHSLEKFQPMRDRFRGSLKTQSLRDFSKYVERHNISDLSAFAQGFIDQDAMSATVVFNLGDADEAGHGDDRATLTLKPSAAYTAVQAIAGKSLGQQALAEWLEDWAPHIIATGTDNIDLEACRRHGVAVANVPGYSIYSVAQMTFSLLLAICQCAQRYDRAVKDGYWQLGIPAEYGLLPQVELLGKTFGIYGYGSIGRQTALHCT